MINSGRTPYTDVGIWGPFGARLAGFRKTETATFVGNELVHRRADRPATFECWLAAWDLFAAAMVSIDAASLGTLNRYRGGLVQLTKLFGPSMWPILVTTDVVVRTERWGRLREQIEANMAIGAPVPGYSRARH